MNWLAKIKTRLCRYMVLIEFCHRCGRKQELTWWCASNEMYEEIAGRATILCPKCFDIEASKRGLPIQWTATKYKTAEESAS